MNPSLKKSTLEEVVKVYTRPDITVTYPNNSKSGKTIKVMKYTLKRTYNMFLAEFSDYKISKTTFDKLKPASVKLMKTAKWLQCLREICDKVNLMIRAINMSFQRTNLDLPECLLDEVSAARATVRSL